MGYPKGDKKKGEPAKNPKPGIPFNKAQILDLIPLHNGNLSRIADVIGSNRGGVRRFIQADPELSEALSTARERRVDTLEECVWDRAVREKDTTLQIFLLKTQARDRGYDQESSHVSDIAREAFQYVVDRTKNPAE